MPTQIFTIGTRASRLALTQTGQVAKLLAQLNPNVHLETVTITTEGDADRRPALEDMGGQGLFTKRIERALLEHEIDIAVHSAKDLPSVMTDGLTLAAVPERESVCDAWLCASGEKLREIGPGAVVGTGSPRRRAQLLHLRPDLKVEGIRGNVDTRLKKLSEGKYDAIVMAHAGLIRAGLADHVTELFDPKSFVPAPGQGALAIQTRVDDEDSIKLARSIDRPDAHRCADIERLLLEKLGAGCSTAVGGYARIAEGRIHLIAVVLDNLGKTHLCVERTIGQDEDNEALLTHIVDRLFQEGARELIAGDK
jgi:hydroxymethylbilane synthase